MELDAHRLPRLGDLRRWIVSGALAIVAPLALGACGQGVGTDYAADWGPEVGTEAPLLSANDQDGNPQTLETLTGTNGLLIVFNRSVDW